MEISPVSPFWDKIGFLAAGVNVAGVLSENFLFEKWSIAKVFCSWDIAGPLTVVGESSKEIDLFAILAIWNFNEYILNLSSSWRIFDHVVLLPIFRSISKTVECLVPILLFGLERLGILVNDDILD